MGHSNRKVPEDTLSLKENNRTHRQTVLFRDNPIKHTFRHAELGHSL